MSEIRVIGILVRNREQNIENVQDVFTKFGCSIRTRLGINVSQEYNSNGTGLILLELTGEVAEMEKLENTLKTLKDVEVKKMIFE